MPGLSTPLSSHSAPSSSLQSSTLPITKLDYPYFADTLLWIKDKEGRIIPFVRNPIQHYTYNFMREHRQKGIRYFNILKYRRGGITTEQQAINFFKTLHQGQSCVTLAHEREDTEKIFGIAKTFYKHLDASYQPLKSAKVKRELEFPELESQFYIGTAGSRTFSRGSTLQRFHASEVAFWPGTNDDINNLIASLTEAASKGEGVLESTPNGVDNWFYTQWKSVEKGRAEWANIFLPWFIDPTNVRPLISSYDNPTPSLSDILNAQQLILSSLTEDEINLIKKHNLTFEQLAWRRVTKDRLRRLFPQEYPEDAETAFLVSGSSYFNVDIVNQLCKTAKDPIRTKYNNTLRIWENPIPGHEYVIGSDIASGVNDEEHDYSTSIVLHRLSGRHVATLKGRIKPHEFTKQSLKLAYLYNTAYWGVERNEYGRAVLADLLNIHNYQNLYVHQAFDPNSREQTNEHGWPTNAKTKPVLIDDLAEAIEEGHTESNDIEFLAQCRHFVLKKGKLGAISGYFDDDIMAYGIAWQVRKHYKRVPTITFG
jgi:hypothetical protein